MKVILDTNLWSYIARDAVSGSFDQLEDQLGIRVVTPPMILLEVMKTGDSELRSAIVAAMTSRRREKPLPEVQRFCSEFVAVVNDLRPEWVRPIPRTDRVPVFENYWTKRVWQEARFTPDGIASVMRVEPTSPRIMAIQRENQDAFRNADKSTRLDTLRVDLQRSDSAAARVGWDHDDVQLWRLDLAALFWNNLVTQRRRLAFDQTWVDWTNPWIDLVAMQKQRGSFNRLWYSEISERAVASSWIVWAVMTKQLDTKIGTGNPVDSTLGAYLIDVELFLSADRKFVRVLNSVVEESPIPFAHSEAVAVEPDGVVAGIEAAISRYSL